MFEKVSKMQGQVPDSRNPKVERQLKVPQGNHGQYLTLDVDVQLSSSPLPPHFNVGWFIARAVRQTKINYLTDAILIPTLKCGGRGEGTMEKAKPDRLMLSID